MCAQNVRYHVRMTSINATQARVGFFGLIKRVLKKHEPLRISHKEGDVIVLSEEDYEGLLETLDILSSPNFRKKYQKSKKQIERKQLVPISKIFGE